MNISLKNRSIWISPECTGGNILAKLFERYDFFVFERQKTLNKRLVSLKDISWTSEIPDEYKDFTKIMTIRNPYSRVYECYENFYNKSLISRDLQKVREKFNQYLEKVFHEDDFFVSIDKNLSKNSYISKWALSEYLPDEILRYETLENDFMNLSLIKNNGIKFDRNKFLDLMTENFDRFDFKLLYTPKNARKVFEYYKNYFFHLGYDPYSFTNEVLSDEDKVNFIHNRF